MLGAGDLLENCRFDRPARRGVPRLFPVGDTERSRTSCHAETDAGFYESLTSWCERPLPWSTLPTSRAWQDLLQRTGN